MQTLAPATEIPASPAQASAAAQPLIPLEDFLGAPNFPDNVYELIGPLATRLKLPPRINEMGVVCTDVLKAAEYLEKKYEGMGPFFLGAGSPEEFTENDVPEPFVTRVGFGYYKNTLIELAEPGTGSNIFRTAYDPGGTITVHHLGFFARGDNLCVSSKTGDRYYLDLLLGAGYTPRFRAVVDAYKFLGRVTVFDTVKETKGVDLEFIDFRLLSKHGPAVAFPPWFCSLAARVEIFFGKRVVNFPVST